MSREAIPVKKPKKVKSLSLHKGQKKKIVYIAKMSDHAFGVQAAFEACGLDAEVLDAPDAQTVKIGRKHVSKECYPCAITTGDMVKRTMASDFDPSRAVFFMPSGTGPCRFGQYNILHRLILDEIGLPEVPIFAPNQDSSFYRELGIVGNDFTRQAWKGVIAIDILMKCLHETRPYENNSGESEELYRNYLKKIQTMIKSKNGSSPELMDEMKSSFSRIPKTNGTRPLIGIIGEIFVRLNIFSNEDVIRKIEALGGEVWLAPMEEWLFYINTIGSRKALMKWKENPLSKNNLDMVLNCNITRFVQKRIEHKLAKPFEGTLKTLKEPSTRKLF
jgi:predicted nucleotide-binding protein (sugar kinase/HSP70/actin superfamily)